MVCNSCQNKGQTRENLIKYVFGISGVGHFEFKMSDILTQNLKSLLLETITMQYKIKTLETLATRAS